VELQAAKPGVYARVTDAHPLERLRGRAVRVIGVDYFRGAWWVWARDEGDRVHCFALEELESVDGRA